MKKIELEKRLYNVVDFKEYIANIDLYNPKNTAIEEGEYVLPLRNKLSDTGPGVYYSEGDTLANIVKPADNLKNMYSKDKIIDFNNSKDINEILEKNEMLKDLQSDLMVSGQDANIFCLSISQDDTPEMAALKRAINSKQVDKKIYEDRFPQFQNDMRLLKGNSITLSKMIGICNGFDIACVLTLKDKDGAANPMGNEITLDLTEGRPIKNNIEEL